MTSATIPSANGTSAIERERRDRLDDALVLEPAAPNSWRVCDSRISARADRILAFVEDKDGVFEVMQIADAFVWSTFPTMRAALTHVVLTNNAVILARPIDEWEWLR